MGSMHKTVRKIGISVNVGIENVMDRLQEVSDAGFQVIELAWRQFEFNIFDEENIAKVDKVVQRARELGMDIWTLHLPFGKNFDLSVLDEEERAVALANQSRLLEIANGWNIHTVVIHPSLEPISDTEREARMQSSISGLSQLAPVAEQHQIRIAVECLPRTCIGNTSDEIKRILAADARLGVCCDVNHLFHETPAQFIREIGPRLFTLHLSDNDGIDECHWVPGDGVIAWQEVLEALDEVDYDGPYLLEVREAPANHAMAQWKAIVEATFGK